MCPDFHGARARAGSTPDNVPVGSFKPAYQLADAVTSAEAGGWSLGRQEQGVESFPRKPWEARGSVVAGRKRHALQYWEVVTERLAESPGTEQKLSFCQSEAAICGETLPNFKNKISLIY